MKLDRLDIKILRILQEDARKSYVKIADQLQVTEGTVRFRIKKLLKNEVITRFLTLIDPRKLGFQITAVVMLKVDGAYIDDVFNKLIVLDESQHVFQSTGEYDIVSIVHTQDLQHLGKLINKIKSFKGVKNATFSVITRFVRVEPTLKL
ncbi:MAG: Lrp/AsnC family transcriptional regulator [Candidatus Bathyarchaeia archaeon]